MQTTDARPDAPLAPWITATIATGQTMKALRQRIREAKDHAHNAFAGLFLRCGVPWKPTRQPLTLQDDRTGCFMEDYAVTLDGITFSLQYSDEGSRPFLYVALNGPSYRASGWVDSVEKLADALLPLVEHGAGDDC
jgi:hypothetical protein